MRRGFYFSSDVLPSARLELCVTDLFQAASSIFVSVTFTEVVIVEKGPFEHCCDQVTFRVSHLKKITITVTEVILIQVSFFTVCSKQN